MATISDILSAVGAYTDIDTSTPTGSDLQARVNYINQAQLEWDDYYDWDVLRRTTNITFAYSGASIALDSNFDQMKSPIMDLQQGTPVTGAYQYIQLDNPKDRFNRLSTDNYFYIMGDLLTGMSIQLNPPMASGVSLQYDWIANPSTLATLSDIPVAPADYLTKRTIAFVLESRSDPRFPAVKVDAQRLLESFVANQDSNFGARKNQIRNTYEQQGFHIGS